MGRIRRDVISAIGCFISLLPTPFVTAAPQPVLDVSQPILIEAEAAVPKGAAMFRDDRASQKRCVVGKLAGTGPNTALISVFAGAPNLPMGDYVVTAYLEAVPIETLHTLDVTIKAGDYERHAGAVEFDPAGGYQPFAIRVFHPGGRLSIHVDARGATGFEGMRKGSSDREKESATQVKSADAGRLLTDEKAKSEVDSLDLDEGGELKALPALEPRVVCDRVEILAVAPIAPPVAVAHVDVDKVHYSPDETVKATATLLGGEQGGAYTFIAQDVTEIDDAREVFKRDVTLSAGKSEDVSFEFKLDGNTEFGHELRCSLLAKDGKTIHASREYFGVSRNVYRIGITGDHGGQNKQTFTAEQFTASMRNDKRSYSNYFECFAWAPCDYSEMTPDTEKFWSGQTQYPGSVSGFKTMIAEAHKLGIKAITYGKACGAGIAGFNTFQKHPELFGRSAATGTASEAFNTFYLERMLANEYEYPNDKGELRGWQHWASLWTNFSEVSADFGADELIASAKMFGWDGVRWDGHFTALMARMRQRINAALPAYVHGYNVAFANPGGPMFLPPAGSPTETEDFFDIATNHGLIMDESARGWSNPNWSAGAIRPFYDAMCSEGDYVKRIGGLPLFITFDVRSAQDNVFNCLIGLAAGERYTYQTSPGDFAFGPLPKFLTRFSAFVWDDTARIAKADQVVSVTPAKGTKPWFDRSTWLRKLPDGRQQLLVNLINPPGYQGFCDRVQTPPTTLTNVSISVTAPPSGAKLIRAIHVSPDLVDGIETLEVAPQTGAVTLPRVRSWSIVVFEYGPADAAKPLAYPAFALTTPVEDAKAYLADAAKKREIAAADGKKKADAGIAPAAPATPAAPYFQDFSRTFNADADAEKKIVKPSDLHLRRNGVLDVHHCHGAFAWLNPIESAAGLCGAAAYQPSWVDRVGFRVTDAGDMDGFSDDYESLLACDVLVLDNVHAIDLGSRRRTMIADFVKNGGGLLVMGGYYNLSMGADRNSALADLLPVTIRKYDDLVRDAKGMKLTSADDKFAWNQVDWNAAGQTLCVDASPPKDGAQVLAKAGDNPAIVASTVGAGRVVTILINPHGDYAAAGAKPYWESSQWPRILASCIAWLGNDANSKYARPQTKPKFDPNKPDPMVLMMEADGLDAATFTAKLRDATANMVDPSSARTLLQTALANVDKVQEPEVIATIALGAGPYLDASFAPMARELASSQEASLRRVGYRVLGLAGDKSQLPLLERGIREDVEAVNVHEALVATALLGDAKAIPIVEAALAKSSPQHKLLPLTVLRRLGRANVMPQALAAYVEAVHYAEGSKIAANQAYEQLHGGMAFALSPVGRRAAQRELERARIRARDARYDLTFFSESLTNLTDAELDAFTTFLIATENDAVTPLAYAVYGRMPRETFARYQPRLRDAKLQSLRLLAGADS